MEYKNLLPQVKRSLNGKLSQYMDVYIRKHKVWTPEQMCKDFQKEINDELEKGWFQIIDDVERKKIIECSLSWLLSSNGQQHTLEKMTNKYDKDYDIAIRESPITERVRFGKWPDYLFDISYGLKGEAGYNRMTTVELRSLKYTAWTIEHVESVLKSKYNLNLEDIFKRVLINQYETDLFNYWLRNYYSAKTPALIPNIKSLKSRFYYFEYRGNLYSSYEEIGVNYCDSEVNSIAFSYNFMIINVPQKKSIFIDIASESTSEGGSMIIKVKQLIAKRNGFDYTVFDYTQIKKSLDRCFEVIQPYLKY